MTKLQLRIMREAKAIKRATGGKVRLSKLGDEFFNLYIDGKHTEMLYIPQTVGFIQGWRVANGLPLAVLINC